MRKIERCGRMSSVVSVELVQSKNLILVHCDEVAASALLAGNEIASKGLSHSQSGVMIDGNLREKETNREMKEGRSSEANRLDGLNSKAP